jgi:hypothetical protein
MLRFTHFRDQLEADGGTLEEALRAVLDRCPSLRPVLFDGEGRFRAVHRLFVDGEPLTGDDLGRTARPDAEVCILTAIAGG